MIARRIDDNLFQYDLSDQAINTFGTMSHEFLKYFESTNAPDEWGKVWREYFYSFVGSDNAFLYHLTGNFEAAFHYDRYVIGHFYITGDNNINGWHWQFTESHKQQCKICQRKIGDDRDGTHIY